MSEKQNQNQNPRNLKKVASAIAGMPSRMKLILFGSLAVLFTFAFPIISNIVGNSSGAVVGTAVGSFHAITEDMPAAYNQGVEDGLSARDIRSEFQNEIREIGKLDVLACNAELTDKYKEGNAYEGIFTFGADVIFSVDITQAIVSVEEGKIKILIPKPVGKINIDSTKTRIEAEWKRPIFDGSTEEGITAYFNSMEAIKNNVTDKISDYAGLEKRAEASAIKQITSLAEMMSTDRTPVEVEFMVKAGENQ